MRLTKATAPAEFPEAWASDWGEDECGLWMAFTFKGVRYGFRWIPPGTFMMGEGKGEHEVMLTQGFWLGETTVTQALWQAVVGNNPSRFKGVDLPVETVSWEECQGFMQALNARQPALNLCLPSEAQWEYACRARTQTIFHFGDSITTDQVNYDGRAPLEGSPKGEYRGKTVPVKALPANAWGLYQMHGNVWEWCGDWLAVYPAEPQHDLVGPDSGQYHVLRGGSWDFGGRNCRSGDRLGFLPGNRFDYTGFRLARGQKEPEAGNK